MIREVIKYPSPILKKRAKEIKFIDKEITKLIDDMKETMYFSNGIGLAGNQIGTPLRIFVWDISEEKNSPQVAINPKIIWKEGIIEFSEGCLSIPGIRIKMKRAEKMKVEYIDENGKRKEIIVEGLQSVLFQHEIDHLDGKLIIDKLSQQQKREIIKMLINISDRS